MPFWALLPTPKHPKTMTRVSKKGTAITAKMAYSKKAEIGHGKRLFFENWAPRKHHLGWKIGRLGGTFPALFGEP